MLEHRRGNDDPCGQDFGTLRGNPPPFARYLHDELIPQIDAAYRTLADYLRFTRGVGKSD